MEKRSSSSKLFAAQRVLFFTIVVVRNVRVNEEGVCVCVCVWVWGRCLSGSEVEDEGDVLGDLLAFYLVMKMEMLSYPRNKDLPFLI